MEFITDIAPSDLTGVKMIAESNQFAIYACGTDTYLLVQRHAGMPWTGLHLSGDGVFRITGLLTEAARDLYREVAGQLSPIRRQEPARYEARETDRTLRYDERDLATERRDLYQDDLTEERQVSPVVREEIAGTIRLDPIDGDDNSGQPLTVR